MKKLLVVRFNIPGFHNWPNPPERYAYLGDKHRHLFHWEIKIQIEKDNRQIEFIHFKDWLISLINAVFLNENTNENLDNHIDFEGRSCEMIAQETKEYIDRDAKSFGFNPKIYSIEVNEDGENGAIVTW